MHTGLFLGCLACWVSNDVSSHDAARSATSPPESVLLSPNYTAGGVRYLELLQQTEQTGRGGPFGPAGRTTRSARTKGVYEKVSVASAKGTRLVFTFDRVAMQAEGPGGGLSFDSDTDDRTNKEDLLASALGPMLGMSVTIELDSQGRVQSCKGMEAIFEKVQKQAPGNPVLQQIQDDLGSETAQLTWADSRFVPFAFKEVKAGDTWTRTIRTRSAFLGDLVRDYQCVLEKFDTDAGRRLALVRYTADVRRPSDGAAGLFAVKSLKSGRMEGTATFDLERREFTLQSEIMTLSLDAEWASPDGAEPSTAAVQTITRQIVRSLTETERSQQKLANFNKAKRGG